MNGDEIRKVERDSIRAFLTAHSDRLKGRVLDYGCGREPYRDIVEDAGGLYLGYDRSKFPANVSDQDVGALGDTYDAIICTQVIQYIATPYMTLARFLYLLGETGGALLMTGPTNWPQVEPEDLHRHTVAGMERLVRRVGFTHVDVEVRFTIPLPSFDLPIGWQLIATP